MPGSKGSNKGPPVGKSKENQPWFQANVNRREKARKAQKAARRKQRK